MFKTFNSFNIHISLICIFLFINISPFTAGNQLLTDKVTLTGTIIDASTKETLPFAILSLSSKNLHTTSDRDGNFELNIQETEKKILISIKYIGYQSLDTLVDITNRNLKIYLQPQNYALREVIVTSEENKGRNSTSKIERTAIEHIQASSFTDILQLLPGKGVEDPNLKTVNLISMRQVGSDLNTSLGTSFIIDGSPLSNEANQQQPLYSLSTAKTNMNQLNTTSKGIDMRTISTDKIESVEVIRGIPSVKYGDLTAGLIKIDMKTGTTPWEARIKTDLSSKLFSVGKGFNLRGKNGAMNIDADYIDYNPDPRTDITSYKRLTLSGRHQNKVNISENNSLLFRTNLSYTGSFDNVKEDQDIMKGIGDYVKNSFNNLFFSTTGSLQNKKSVLENINYGLSFQYTKESFERKALISQNGTSPLSTALEEGAYYADYLPNEYESFLKIDGQPIHFNGNIDARFRLDKGKVNQQLLIGTEYRYDKNLGDGQIYDLNRPPYPSNTVKSTRPRPFNRIPAIQKLSIYAQDELKYFIRDWLIYAEAGIRGTTLPGMDKEYVMSNRIYWEPRLNTKITFPAFEISGNPIAFALTGGIGQLYKFPTQNQLYPENIYIDYVQLNYYSQQADLRRLHIRTYIEDPTNYHLVPAKNKKIELGFSLSVNKTKLDVVFFHEKMKNGFSSNQAYTFHTYQNYDASSVNPSTITQKPSIEDFTYTNDTALVVYDTNKNNAFVDKKGFEYTFDIGQIRPLYTKIRINGAYFLTTYKTNDLTYSYPNRIINGHPYPYIGVYEYNKSNDYKESQLNTNLFFDTHIPKLRMIFTTSLQTIWYSNRTEFWNNGLPSYYIDKGGNKHIFSEKDAGDPVFVHLVDTYSTGYFKTNKETMSMSLNLRLTKEIGDKLRMAFFVNRILSYLPNYTNKNGTTMNRSNLSLARPYFGAELFIKL